MKNDTSFQKMKRKAAQVIAVCANIKVEIEESEEVNMCKAWEDQRKEGVEEGNAVGQNIILTLINYLVSDNRMEDVKKIAQDVDYKNQLLAEYKLLEK